MTELPAFTSEDWYHLTGRGDLFSTKLDRDTVDFGHIIGQQILVDGHPCIGRGVERFTHSPPWRAGEPIAILVNRRPVTLSASASDPQP